MKSTITCQCRSTCRSKRCACVNEGKACVNNDCGCSQCENPFNTIENPESLTDCARDHIKKVTLLSEKILAKKYNLPCDCERATLKALLYDDACCHKCGCGFYYSFCADAVLDDHDMWHCFDCGTCREDSEWHCEYCNKCTYGLSLKCENCGRKSLYIL